MHSYRVSFLTGPALKVWNWSRPKSMELVPPNKEIDWLKSRLISTEGDLRLPTTYDSHPTQPIPSVQPTKPL